MGNVCLLQQSEANGNWSGPIALGGTAKLVAGYQNSDGRLEVFWTDENNNIFHNWQTSANSGSSYGAWIGATAFGGTAKQLALRRDQQNRLTLVYIGLDDQLYTTYNVGGLWVPAMSFGEQTVKQFTIGRNSDGRLEILLIGLADNFIYDTWQSLPDLGWKIPIKTPWAAKQIALGQNHDGRLEFFYVGLDDQIYHAWQQVAAAGPWLGAKLSGGAQTIVTGNNSDGRISIFYIGLDGYIYHNSQIAPNSRTWGGNIRAYQNPDPEFPIYDGRGVTLALANNADGRLQLFYEGTDGWAYSTWEGTPNGTYTGGNRSTPATAFSPMTAMDQRISLFYVGETYSPVATAFIEADSGQAWVQCSGLMPESQIFVLWGTSFGNQSTQGSSVFTAGPDNSVYQSVPDAILQTGIVGARVTVHIMENIGIPPSGHGWHLCPMQTFSTPALQRAVSKSLSNSGQLV
jgi:hypothetical protein